MEKIKNGTFRFAGKSWHELDFELAISYKSIEETLTSNLVLTNYGAGLAGILCFFVCAPFDDPNKERERFYTKDKEIFIVRQLNYEIFSRLSLEDAVKMQAQVFLAALEKVKNRKKQIPDFDFHRFYADVEKLFKEKNWL